MAKVNNFIQKGSTARRPKETQSQYWEKFGVEQPAGCTYEKGRPIPLPTAMLIELLSSKIICEADLKLVKAKILRKRPKKCI
jgi:hypothetical protein